MPQEISWRTLLKAAAPWVAVGCLAACAATAVPPTRADQVGEYYRPGSGYWRGYLSPTTQVDLAPYPASLAFLPAPPAAGSLELRRDEEVYQRMKTLRPTPRGDVAVADADLKSPMATAAFDCALGVDIGAAPNLEALMRRTLNDAALVTFSAKEHYQRVRPFRQHGEPSLTPKDEAGMKNDSYPSGHAAIGWTWGLVLSALDPARANALLARAYAYGQSRLIVGAHWASDVEGGRLAGAAAVAAVGADPVYRRQFELARQELARLRAQGSQPRKDCAAESAALGIVPSL